jgi:hypothetical protein
MFYCASTNSADLCPKSEPQEQRGLTLCTLSSRLQKQKARSNPYMVIFNFIGYFVLMLCDFLLLGAMWLSSCSDFSGFISLLCHPYLPATFSGLRPTLFCSVPPPCYRMTALDVPLFIKRNTKYRKHSLLRWYFGKEYIQNFQKLRYISSDKEFPKWWAGCVQGTQMHTLLAT